MEQLEGQAMIDNFNEDGTSVYTTIESSFGRWQFNRNYPEGTSWDAILTDFITLLSAAYGYEIGSQVDYHGNPHVPKWAKEKASF